MAPKMESAQTDQQQSHPDPITEDGKKKKRRIHNWYAVDGRDSQALDPTLIKSFADLRDSDSDFALDKFQIVRILSNLRQYRLLSGLYEKAIRSNGSDRFAWLQFSLSLSADRRFLRVLTKIQSLRICIWHAYSSNIWGTSTWRNQQPLKRLIWRLILGCPLVVFFFWAWFTV
uniref:Uncharacterized protein n=1 Tax=Globodera rostochiensis TaxID=31243 RepID=A0A914HD40_GLORO